MVSPVCLETGDISLSFAPFYSSGNWTQKVNELTQAHGKERAGPSRPAVESTEGEGGRPWLSL